MKLNENQSNSSENASFSQGLLSSQGGFKRKAALEHQHDLHGAAPASAWPTLHHT